MVASKVQFLAIFGFGHYLNPKGKQNHVSLVPKFPVWFLRAAR